MDSHLDPEGYIRAEADLANVQPEYQGVADAAASLLAHQFGSRLHSAYLYGSIVRGNAVPGRSDVDLVAVLLAPPTEEDRRRARRVEQALAERFAVLTSAGVSLTHLREVRSPAQRYGWQVFLRELSVCIGGQALRSSTDPEVIRSVCRMASRRMVQVAFAVAMARKGVWATVLEEQAAAVGTVFPQWTEAARRSAEQGRRPVAEAGVVLGLLDTFGRWAEDALDQVAPSAINGPER